MEYRKLIEISRKLNRNNDININRIILTNPVDKYNFVIDQYNKDYNIIEDKKLSNVKCDSIYYLGHIIENGVWSFLIIYLVIPFPFLVLNKIILSDSDFIIFLLLSIYFGILFSIVVITFVVYLAGKRIYRKNSESVPNPFMKMIFLPEMCRLLNVINKHFELNEEEIQIFNFSENQMRLLKINDFDKKYRFMIYDQNFVDYYSEINTTTLLLKHILWIFCSVGFYFLTYFIIYQFKY